MVKKYTILDMQKLANKREGICLSKKYINANTKITWQCAKGHTWEADPSHIKRGQWCPSCGGTKKLSIKDMHDLAKKMGGICLSKKYINIDTKLKWRCAKGHTWEAIPYSIKIGKWCPKCRDIITAKRMRKHTLKEISDIAKKRGGKCLSKKYVNWHKKLKWQCKEGHIWEASFSNISRGTWCPVCSYGLSERICRKFFEIIFNKKFPISRPKWLKIGKRTFLHLDGYNEELKLAFEYHGKQHYEDIGIYNNILNLDKRKEYDNIKRNLCKKNLITLIEIPYTVEYEDMDEYIVSKCKEKRIMVPTLTKKLDHKLFDVYSPKKLFEMQELAKMRNGRCLSKSYINNSTNLSWECNNNHNWEATPANIKKGTWCPVCAEKNKGASQRLNIEHVQLIAKSFNGKCLSQEYKNARTKLKWQCSKGHIFESILSNIKKGYWCRECSGKRPLLSIKKLKKLAKKRNGKCLSKEYLSNKTKLKWQCSKGHTWLALPSQVKKGTWCPVCAGNLKLSIKQMQILANRKNGKCLSQEYKNARTKLKWQCSKGHIFESTPDRIQQSRWCPKCNNG